MQNNSKKKNPLFDITFEDLRQRFLNHGAVDLSEKYDIRCQFGDLEKVCVFIDPEHLPYFEQAVRLAEKADQYKILQSKNVAKIVDKPYKIGFLRCIERSDEYQLHYWQTEMSRMPVLHVVPSYFGFLNSDKNTIYQLDTHYRSPNGKFNVQISDLTKPSCRIGCTRRSDLTVNDMYYMPRFARETFAEIIWGDKNRHYLYQKAMEDPNCPSLSALKLDKAMERFHPVREYLDSHSLNEANTLLKLLRYVDIPASCFDELPDIKSIARKNKMQTGQRFVIYQFCLETMKKVFYRRITKAVREALLYAIYYRKRIDLRLPDKELIRLTDPLKIRHQKYLKRMANRTRKQRWAWLGISENFDPEKADPAFMLNLFETRKNFVVFQFDYLRFAIN